MQKTILDKVHNISFPKILERDTHLNLGLSVALMEGEVWEGRDELEYCDLGLKKEVVRLFGREKEGRGEKGSNVRRGTMGKTYFY